MGSLGMRDGMEWRDGMTSSILPLASLWAGLSGETHVYRGRMDGWMMGHHSHGSLSQG